MINTCTKSTEVFGYDTEGKILQKETSKFPAGVRGSTKPQQIHFTTHEPRTAEQLAVLKKEGKPVEIHWWETAEHCSMLLETEFFESPEHEARIKLFRDLAMICDPTIKPAGESHAWTAVGRYIHIKVTNCDECHTLVSDHQMGRHWQKENVHPKKIEGYTYVRLRGKPVCPICIRTFQELSQLQEHMGKVWTSKQLYNLGYREDLFRGFVAWNNKREALRTSLPSA